MIYIVLLHYKSICCAHNPTYSVGEAGVLLDHLIGEQMGSERFQGANKSDKLSKVLTFVHVLFFNSQHLPDSD
jgi:hypothetical protein